MEPPFCVRKTGVVAADVEKTPPGKVVAHAFAAIWPGAAGEQDCACALTGTINANTINEALPDSHVGVSRRHRDALMYERGSAKNEAADR